MPQDRKRKATASISDGLAKRFCLVGKAKPKRTRNGLHAPASDSRPSKQRKTTSSGNGKADGEPRFPECAVGSADETAENHFASHGGTALPANCARCRFPVSV